MTLNQLINLIVETSGRYDLLSPLGDSTRILHYINEAQRLLDRMSPFADRFRARVYANLESNAYNIFMNDCRVIEEVWLIKEDGRVPLIKADLGDLEVYFNQGMTERTPGTPCYWAQGIYRAVPSNAVYAASEADTIAGFNETSTIAEKSRGICVYPISDGHYNVQVIGIFYTPKLSNTMQETFWTEHSTILQLAVMYVLESLNRNSEGQRDLLASIEQMIQGLSFDIVDENTQGDLSMGDPDYVDA